MAQFAKPRFIPTAPDKGSFPLDHDGVCKNLMSKYMSCLSSNRNDNTKCREEIKLYLDCRMNHNLMAKEEWKNLGLDDVDADSKVVQKMEGGLKKWHILVCCTGSVATIKLNQLLESILKHEFEVRVVVTKCAQHFFDPTSLPSVVKIYCDADEWALWGKRGDPVLHIDLGKWADVIILAPLDANTLAKISQGICDNLLTCVVRAWDVKKPLLFCPAMNTKMWHHPVTASQISVLKEWGYIEVPCIEKTLMCGDTGLGAMAEIGTIVSTLLDTLGR